jgi:serine/threonine-protein kinase
MSDVRESVPPRLRAALAERYAIEREVGRGGMATVYLARDLRHGRPVAVKVLSPVLTDKCCEPDRFLREIHIAARLVHPGILPLHDSGECDGFVYYVMPFLEGDTLRERLRRDGRMPVAAAVGVARALAAALDYAHRQGVVHRDIKPENVIFHEGAPLLADFGVARALWESGRPGQITEAGVAVGTPEYMSPEQASGEHDLDPRSDQYSLACVLHEMLTGEPPFAAGSPRAVMARHVTAAPPSLRAQRPEVPAAVDAAVRRALAKDPAARFATVLEFADALSGPPAPVMRAPGTALAIAVLPFTNLSADPDTEYLSDGITEELIDALAHVEGLRVASRTSVFALKGKPQDVRAIGAHLGVVAVLEGSVRQQGRRLRISARLTSTDDGRHLWSERYDREVADVFAIEDEIARTIVQTLRATLLGSVGDPTPRPRTQNTRAHALYLKGRYAWSQRTPEGVAQAVAYFEQAIAEDPGYALAYTGLSDAHALHLDYTAMPVAEGFARAKEFAYKALALDEELAEAHTSLAWVLFIYDWDWPAALRHFDRAVEVSPGYATAHQWRAFPLLALGRAGEGLAAIRTALELDPTSVPIRRSMGWACYYTRHYDDALDHLRRAIALNPAAEETHRVRGLVHLLRGAYGEAEAAYREALALTEDSAYAAAGLGATLARAGRGAEARAVLARLEERARTQYVSSVPFAILHLALGDIDRTFAAIERAHAERRGWMAYLRVDPMLDPLRGDPRFEEWLRRMRL